MKNAYEFVLLLPTEKDEKKIKEVLDEVSKLIEKKKGKVLQSTNWGIKDLHYCVKKQLKANYWLLNFEMDGKEVRSIIDSLKHNEDILRYLIVKKE